MEYKLCEVSIESIKKDPPILEKKPPIKKRIRKKQKSYRKKVERDWSDEDTLILIQEIEPRRRLWDIGCWEYSLPKDSLWQEVANVILVSINDCKSKWSNLRTAFYCNLEKYRKAKSDNRFVSISWKYFKPMMFMATNKVLNPTELTSSLQMKPSVDEPSRRLTVHHTPSTKISTNKRLRKITVSTSLGGKTGSVNSKEKAVEALQPICSQTNLMEKAVEEPQSICSQPTSMEKAVEALQPIFSQPKDPSTALCDYMASELQNLDVQQSAFARSQLRRAFSDIMDQVMLMNSPYPKQEQQEEIVLQESTNCNEVLLIPKEEIHYFDENIPRIHRPEFDMN